VQINGQPAMIQQSIEDYRRFGPIWAACVFVTRQKGREENQRLEIDSLEINPSVPEGMFKQPIP
jgi:hypothetical protein